MLCIHSRNKLQLTINFKVEYKTIPIQLSTKLILAPIIYYKRLVDMHDQYDEEAEGENGKEKMMMMTTKMLKNLVLYL